MQHAVLSGVREDVPESGVREDVPESGVREGVPEWILYKEVM